MKISRNCLSHAEGLAVEIMDIMDANCSKGEYDTGKTDEGLPTIIYIRSRIDLLFREFKFGVVKVAVVIDGQTLMMLVKDGEHFERLFDAANDPELDRQVVIRRCP